MIEFTYFTSYYNQVKMLEWHIKNWNSYPNNIIKKMKILIVDDYSPTPAEDIIKNLEIKFDLSLYRVLDKIAWNQGGAANLAFKEAQTDWVLHSGTDHYFTYYDISQILNIKRKMGKFYTFARETSDGKKVRPLGDIYLIHKDDFWKAGGYDEDFAGTYGFTDKLPCRRRNEMGIRETHVEHITVKVSVKSAVRSLSRDTGRNKRLLLKKISGEIPFSKNNIRFKWKKII